MSYSRDNIDPALREELVAYLDGELDAPASRRIEELLAGDPNVRSALQGLDRTWQILDQLDAPEIDESFTRTTLEMAAVAAESDADEARRTAPRRRRLRWVLAGGGLVAACAAGFLGVALFAPDPNQQVLQDLPILERFDQYRQVEGIDFLRMLQREKLFTEDLDDGQ
jgi:anti-sigma factor RsiW